MINRKKILQLQIVGLFLIVLPTVVCAEPKKIAPDKQCPVCGMYPARYPRFNCEIIFNDGSYEAFDSALCLLTYLLFPEKIQVKPKPVSEIFFKDYLKSKWLEADRTYFVIGSDLTGPMGKEFIAVDSLAAAKRLKKDEHGRDIISYKSLNKRYMIKAAKKGWLHYLATSIVLK